MNSHTAIKPPRNVVRELEEIAARIRAEQPSYNLVPFPDPVGDDRDDYVRIIEVEQWK